MKCVKRHNGQPSVVSAVLAQIRQTNQTFCLLITDGIEKSRCKATAWPLLDMK